MLDLKRLKELWEKSTPGTWKWVPDKYRGGYSGIVNEKNDEVLFPNHCNDGDDGDAWFEDMPSEADREILVEGHNSMPALVAWIKKAIPVLQAIEPLARVYCRFVCADKNPDHCDLCGYINEDIVDAAALLKEVAP